MHRHVCVRTLVGCAARPRAPFVRRLWPAVLLGCASEVMKTWHIAALTKVDGEYFIFSSFGVDLSECRLSRIVVDGAGHREARI
ncbi:hypothetical protein MICRO80W_540006 [Micrococcus luteus]|nr:hypothetical protein MICRO80W_540006 [Micrococcus luteus]